MGNCNLLYKQSYVVTTGELILKDSPRRKFNKSSTTAITEDRKTNCQSQSFTDSLRTTNKSREKENEEEMITVKAIQRKTEESRIDEVESNDNYLKCIELIQRGVRK